MSRIGNVPVVVPKGVELVVEKNEVRVKGPKGQLSFVLPPKVALVRESDQITIQRAGDDNRSRAFHGLAQRMIKNMVIGVTDGFKKEMEISGVGYRAALDGNKLVLSLGFSHPVALVQPEDVKFEVPKPTTIIVSGVDKQRVGQVAAEIRGWRPPEPYKGKGIRYAGEKIRRKAGKKASK